MYRPTKTCELVYSYALSVFYTEDCEVHFGSEQCLETTLILKYTAWVTSESGHKKWKKPPYTYCITEVCMPTHNTHKYIHSLTHLSSHSPHIPLSLTFLSASKVFVLYNTHCSSSPLPLLQQCTHISSHTTLCTHKHSLQSFKLSFSPLPLLIMNSSCATSQNGHHLYKKTISSWLCCVLFWI